MGWRIGIEAKDGATIVAARDPLGRRHMGLVAPGSPARLTPLGPGPHHPCRLIEALGLDECLIAPPAPGRPGDAEMRATREAAVGAPLNWRTRLQAAAELDRLSGAVFDELFARGASPGRIGLAPALHLALGREPPIPVRLGTEAEMRRDFVEERRRRGARPGDAPLTIAAMSIAAFAPAATADHAPPPPGAPPLDLARGAVAGAVAGPGALVTSAGVFQIDHGWIAAPASGAVARLRRGA